MMKHSRIKLYTYSEKLEDLEERADLWLAGDAANDVFEHIKRMPVSWRGDEGVTCDLYHEDDLVDTYFFDRDGLDWIIRHFRFDRTYRKMQRERASTALIPVATG